MVALPAAVGASWHRGIMELRRVALGLVTTALLVVIGCAGIEDALGTAPGADSGRDAGACSVESFTPPAIVLSTTAGDQAGEQLSFCTDDPQRGCGICVDTTRIDVKRFTVVHTGDTVSLGMPDGTLITPGPDRCQPACPPRLTIVTLCAKEVVQSQTLTEDEAWTIDLAPGAYEIGVGTSFEAPSLTGSTSNSFGLIVDDTRERGIVAAGAPGSTCGP